MAEQNGAGSFDQKRNRTGPEPATRYGGQRTEREAFEQVELLRLIGNSEMIRRVHASTIG